jgi:hypothetical protein
MTEREYQRARLIGEVVIMNGAPPEVGRAVNISLGGIFFRCRNPRPIGTPLDMTITIPHNRRLQTNGNVIRVAHHVGEELPVGIAVKFEGIPPEGRTEIESYVRYTTRVLKALFFELSRARINESKIRELVNVSPIPYQYPIDILREKIASELSYIRLRMGRQFRK